MAKRQTPAQPIDIDAELETIAKLLPTQHEIIISRRYASVDEIATRVTEAREKIQALQLAVAKRQA